MSQERAKQRAASVSLTFNVLSTLIKVVAAIITGSVSLMSEAAHSGTDIFASFLAFVSVKAASAPPDEDHPYGHGKIETLAGFGEAIFLLMIVAFVGWESIHRLLKDPEPVSQIWVGIGVMAVSSLLAAIGGWHVGRVAKQTHSPALLSNSQHLWVDCWTSVGVLVALLIVHFTGWLQADAVLAILLSIWLAFGAWKLIRSAFHDLIDRRLPDEEVSQIQQILDEFPDMVSYHKLRSRWSGSTRYVDLHIVVPSDWSVIRAHQLADDIEHRIEDALPPSIVTIHVDPFDDSSHDA